MHDRLCYMAKWTIAEPASRATVVHILMDSADEGEGGLPEGELPDGSEETIPPIPDGA